MDIGKTLKVRNSLEWRRWLTKHHADTKEIWVVYYKKASGKSGISYEESVVEGLAYGWIDGQTKSIDDATYACRFTPRRPGSNWSASNITRVKIAGGDNSGLEPGTVTVEATAEDLGDNVGVLNAAVDGPEQQIIFNVKYLAEVLAVIDTPEVAIEVNSPTKPGVVKPVGPADYTYVIMPMHTNR